MNERYVAFYTTDVGRHGHVCLSEGKEGTNFKWEQNGRAFIGAAREPRRTKSCPVLLG
jgi:hypothetical protein